MSTDISLATGRFLDFHSAQTIGRRLSHGVSNSPPDVNSRRSSALTPRRESSPEPIQEVEPTRPNLLLPRGTSSSSLTPKHDLSPRSPTTRYCPAIPSRDIGSAAKKFSYVDVNSSSFKYKISKLQNNDSTNSRQLSPCSPQDADSNTLNSEDCTLNRENWANISGKSVEHIIEIIIPDENHSQPDVMSKSDKVNVPKPLREKPKRANLSSLGDAAKPTIVSYIQRKQDGECSNDATSSDHEHSKPASPLQKLSREELLTLIETPEQELKNSILEALKYKDPT